MKIILVIISCILAFPGISQVKLKKENESCAGLKDGRIEVVLDSIDGPFEYQWKDLTNNVMLSEKSAVLANLKPGSYGVTITVGGNCMDEKAAIIYPGKQVSLVISSQGLSYTPSPIPCGTRPSVTILLTAQASGGTPPYYCSWSKSRDMTGACERIVSGKDIEEPLAVIDSLGCTAFRTWTHSTLVKICPKDPNDIAGPDGYDTSRWVSVHDEMEYTVRFENDPVFATSAASVVLVTVPIDDDINPFSFRLGTIGFGSQLIEIPENQTFYQQRIDYTDSTGYMVDITAGLDLPNNRFFWLMETIDPLTGQPPTDPTAGFLPVNDTLTGSGEGFIHFTCKPKSSTLTGEFVEEQASIVFDANEAILTNVWKNKIDAFGPSVMPESTLDTFETNIIPFEWLVTDDPGGCGVSHAQVLLSRDGIDFEANGFIVDTNETQLELDWDAKYYYRIIGVDHVNNVGSTPLDSFYIIPERSIRFLTPDEDVYCIGDTLWLNMVLTSLPEVDLYYSLDTGATFLSLAQELDTFPYAIVLDSTFLNIEVLLQARYDLLNLVKTSDPFVVNPLPVLLLSDPVTGCDNEILFVEAEGANDFHWWPDSIMGTPNNRYSNVYADISQYAYVEGIDVYGCRNIDSVYLTIYPSSRDTVLQPLCEGDSIQINNEWITDEGYFPTEYSSIQGCDSIIVSQVYYESPCIWNGGLYVYVDQDATGMNNGTSWQNAFNQLSDAVYVAGRYENVKEIWVAEGIYKPHATRRDTSFILKDSIKIFGGFLGVETTREERTDVPDLVQVSGDIGNPNDSLDNVYHIFIIGSTCQECVLDGMTIKFGQADLPSGQNSIGAGIMNLGKLQLVNCIVERNISMDEGAAIYNSGIDADLVIRDCLFRLNTSALSHDILNSSGAEIRLEGINGIEY